jgi:hypothetical protein
MKIYPIIALVLLVAHGLLAQSGHSMRFESLQNPDSLLFELTLITASADTHAAPKISINTAFDAINQYPYLNVACQAATQDTVWFDMKMNRWHEYGHLTLYALDHKNQAQFIAAMHRDTAEDVAWQWRIPLDSNSVQYVVAVLSAAPLLDAEIKLSSLEMTNGSFLYRQRRIFGAAQVSPMPWWRLVTGERVGIEWEHAQFPATPEAYLPIVFYLQRS